MCLQQTVIRLGAAVLLLSLLFPSAVYALDCEGAPVKPDPAVRPVRILALEYPMGISFAQWLEQMDSRVTCRLFERLKLTPDFVLMPFRRAFAEMEAGHADIMVGADYIFEPDVRCHLKMIVYRYYRVLAYYYAREPDPHEPKTLQDFSGKSIVTVDSKWFSQVTGLLDVEVIAVREVASKFVLLRSGRADYVLEEAGQLDRLAEGLTMPPGADESGHFFSVSTPFSVAYAGLVVNTRRPGMAALADRLARELDHLRDEAGFKELVRDDPSYLGRQAPSSLLFPEAAGAAGNRPCPPVTPAADGQ
ncbi:MAG: transporter substrate-binding domain-containing protein [Thiothrix sp.]|nr:transporter substrate-binding domain-containing protein [Thiothrix sp.]HPQ97355.1 transporter substrate-binding domain-containing protein [Thiolinea sp.]